jgi:hypothetical protein
MKILLKIMNSKINQYLTYNSPKEKHCSHHLGRFFLEIIKFTINSYMMQELRLALLAHPYYQQKK